jgi:hypothetical protein
MQKPKTIARYGQIRPARLILDPQLSDEQIIALNQFTYECDATLTGTAKAPVWMMVAQGILDVVCRHERDHVTAVDTAAMLGSHPKPARPQVDPSELCDHVYGLFESLPIPMLNAERVYDEPIRSLLVELYGAMLEYAPQMLNMSMWSQFEHPVHVVRFDRHMLELQFTRPV